MSDVVLSLGDMTMNRINSKMSKCLQSLGETEKINYENMNHISGIMESSQGTRRRILNSVWRAKDNVFVGMISKLVPEGRVT